MSFLSLSVWIRFLEQFVSVVHPVVLLLALIGAVHLWREHRPRWPMAMLFPGMLVGFNLFVRWFMFFLGYSFNRRYFLVETVAAVVLAGSGLDWLAARLQPWMERRWQRPLPAWSGAAAALLLLFAIMLPKTLKVSDNRLWIVKMAETVRGPHTATPPQAWLSRPTSSPLFWMERPDYRLPYLANGRLLGPPGFEDMSLAAKFDAARQEAAGADLFYVTRREPAQVAEEFADAQLPVQWEMVQVEPYDKGRVWMLRLSAK